MLASETMLGSILPRHTSNQIKRFYEFVKQIIPVPSPRFLPIKHVSNMANNSIQSVLSISPIRSLQFSKMHFNTNLTLIVLLSALICSALTLPSGNPKPDDNSQDSENGDSNYEDTNSEWEWNTDDGQIQEPDPDWSPIDVSFTGPEDDLGLGRFQYADILLMSYVHQPIDRWDYTLLNASTNNRHIKESGREHISYFTRENFPDVSIVFTCSEGDVNYFFNERLDVPIIGVEAFATDYPFQYYLNHVFSIHAFWNRPDMWAHFFSHPRAFYPIISRVSREYRTYLEEWSPLPDYDYNPDLENGYGDDTVEPDAEYSDGGYSRESDNQIE